MMPTARELIAAELAGQQVMWGADRDDNLRGEMRDAAISQLILVSAKEEGANSEEAVSEGLGSYPQNWNGFRDYGSEVANLVVAAAFLESEIDRLLRSGADTTRTKRQGSYVGPEQPRVPFPG
jgi:hypothetical protein